MSDNLKNKSKTSLETRKILLLIVLIILMLTGAFIIYKLMSNNNSLNANTNDNKNGQSITGNLDASNENVGNQTINTNIEYDKNGAFLMEIEQMEEVNENGTIVSGKIERGILKLNDVVQIIGITNDLKTAKVTEIEMLSEKVDNASAGDNVKVVISVDSQIKVEQGQVLAKPNSMKNSAKFDADIYMFTKEEGGRLTAIEKDYKPQFCFRSKDIVGSIKLLNDVEKVNPGENAKITVELYKPMAMEKGSKFTILEGKKIVGNGIITKVY